MRARPTKSSRGFTLLEVLLSTVMGGILVYAGYSFLSYTHKHIDSEASRAMAEQELNLLFTQLRRDILERKGTGAAILVAPATPALAPGALPNCTTANYVATSPCSNMQIVQQNDNLTNRSVNYSTDCKTSFTPVGALPTPPGLVGGCATEVTRLMGGGTGSTITRTTRYGRTIAAASLCFRLCAGTITTVIAEATVVYHGNGTSYKSIHKTVSIPVVGDRAPNIQPLIRPDAF